MTVRDNPGRRARRRRDLVNLVVYDATQTNPMRRPGVAPRRRPAWWARLNPVSLAFWWRVGGGLFRVLGRADAVIAAVDWEDAWRRIAAAADRRDARIALLQFWGHGSDGTMWIAGDAFDLRDIEDAIAGSALTRTRDRLDPDRGTVWFRGCNTFRGATGQRFAERAATFFRVPVVGHLYVIWLFHSGTHVLAPGQSAGWPAVAGYGRGRKDPWSGPRKANTIAMVRFHPPSSLA